MRQWRLHAHDVLQLLHALLHLLHPALQLLLVLPQPLKDALHRLVLQQVRTLPDRHLLPQLLDPALQSSLGLRQRPLQVLFAQKCELQLELLRQMVLTLLATRAARVCSCSWPMQSLSALSRPLALYTLPYSLRKGRAGLSAAFQMLSVEQLPGCYFSACAGCECRLSEDFACFIE